MTEHEESFEERQAMYLQEAEEVERQYGPEVLLNFFQNLAQNLAGKD